MSAPSPRPNAFLGISNYLLCELTVPLCALAMDIIENNRLTKTRSLGEANVPGDQALKDLRAKETTQIRGNLPRECRPLIVHCKKNAFDLQARIKCSPDAHECVE